MEHWHLSFSTVGRKPAFPTEAARRAAVRVLGRTAGPHLVLFCIVDDHLHVVVQARRAQAGRLAQALALGLAPVAATPLGAAHLQPVEDRSHLLGLVRYLLTLPGKHGLGEHPALWSGSCFQDIVGARVVAPLSTATSLPRLHLRELLPMVGLPPQPTTPLSDDALRALGASRVVAAVASALAVGPDLVGRAASVVAARRAAAALTAQAGIASAELCWALSVPARAASRLRAQAVDEHVLRAARLRLAIEEAVAHGSFVFAEAGLVAEAAPTYETPSDGTTGTEPQ